MTVHPQGPTLTSFCTGAHQRTLQRGVARSGPGLHTGIVSWARLLPAEENAGVVFRASGREHILGPELVSSTDRCTALELDGICVRTVEHLLAALQGMAVDNVLVEVDGPEVPALDGSAAGWVEAIAEAGIAEQCADAVVATVTRPFAMAAERSWFIVEPAETLSLTCVLHYSHKLLGTMVGAYRIEPGTFAAEIAGARTYGFYSEVKELLRKGQALGGTLENALIIYEDAFSSDLRYPDEIVRHKALDLVGDLYVLGRRFVGHITAVRPGHTVNHAFVRALAGRQQAREPVATQA